MKKNNTEDFIIKAKTVHGDKYDYSKVEYELNNIPVKIICPKHGVFEKAPAKHVSGKQGCPKCSIDKQINRQKKGLDVFINEAKEIHGNKYDYSMVEYINNRTKVTIICDDHGEFEQTPTNHLSGKGCKYCGGTAKMDTKLFIKKAKEVYNDKYDYSKVNYINNTTDVIIICPEHGEFITTPNNFISKNRGCPYCKFTVFDNQSFIEKMSQIHNNIYDYSKVDYVDIKTPVTIICPEHGEFELRPDSHRNGSGCKKCSNAISNIEKDIVAFIKSFSINVLENCRTVLNGKELDIYIPEYKLAIEFNGLYWHSELHKDKNYHVDKTNECEVKGIQLIHIFEDEWLDKQDIVKSRLKNLLGLTENKIYARKCEIKEVPTKEKTKFLNDNHIQGSVGSKVNLGLYHNNELVSIMTFGKRGVIKHNKIELLRFCNKLNTNVIGGASKLLKHFISQYEPKEIISYADRRWSNGNMYETLGFNLKSTNKPAFTISKGKKRESRFKYQKHRLIDMGFDCDGKTADEILRNNGLYKIYDCGSYTYILNNK